MQMQFNVTKIQVDTVVMIKVKIAKKINGCMRPECCIKTYSNNNQNLWIKLKWGCVPNILNEQG